MASTRVLSGDLHAVDVRLEIEQVDNGDGQRAWWWVEINGERKDKRSSQGLATSSAALSIDDLLMKGHDVCYTVYKADGRKRMTEYFYADEPVVTSGKRAW